MTRHPFDPAELGSDDPALQRVAERLESYASGLDGEPSPALTARILAAAEAEAPRGGLAAILVALRRPARALAAAAIVVAAVMGGLAFSQLVDRPPDVGASPVASPAPSATPTASPSPSPSAIIAPSPSPTLRPTPTPVATNPPTPATTPVPTASDDDEIETPEPSESDDDNSGPGGGDG
jgi:hypothetical protein